MNNSDQSSVTEQASRKFARRPLAVTAAALIALSALGLALGQDMRFASAEPAQPATRRSHQAIRWQKRARADR